MKKILLTLLLAAGTVACLPSLPEIVTLPDVELPVVAEQAQTWNPASVKNKPILMVFMGSWCPWCKKTMPAVMEIAEAYGDRVEIVAVFMDGEPEPVKKALQEHRFTVTSLYDGSDLAQGLEVNGLPHSILFDKKHRAIKHWEGFSPERAADYREALDKIVK